MGDAHKSVAKLMELANAKTLFGNLVALFCRALCTDPNTVLTEHTECSRSRYESGYEPPLALKSFSRLYFEIEKLQSVALTQQFPWSDHVIYRMYDSF